MALLSIPDGVFFPLYSELSAGEQREVPEVFNRFQETFRCPLIGEDQQGVADLNKDHRCSERPHHPRELLFAWYAGRPLAIQQFWGRADISGGVAYDEGIFVEKPYRGRGLAMMLCEALYTRLLERGTHSFYVGKERKGNRSAPVLERKSSRALAEGIIQRYPPAIKKVERDRHGEILSYGLTLRAISLRYPRERLLAINTNSYAC